MIEQICGNVRLTSHEQRLPLSRFESNQSRRQIFMISLDKRSCLAIKKTYRVLQWRLASNSFSELFTVCEPPRREMVSILRMTFLWCTPSLTLHVTVIKQCVVSCWSSKTSWTQTVWGINSVVPTSRVLLRGHHVPRERRNCPLSKYVGSMRWRRERERERERSNWDRKLEMTCTSCQVWLVCWWECFLGCKSQAEKNRNRRNGLSESKISFSLKSPVCYSHGRLDWRWKSFSSCLFFG